MEAGILKELSILSIITAALATLLGLLSQRAMGVLFLGFSTIVACGLCLVGFRLYGWMGLLLGIFLATLGGYFLGRMFGKRRGGLFVAFLWLGFCASCAVGYWAAGWVGWLTITLPSVALFWYSLWRFSGRLLPIEMRRRSWWLWRYLLKRLFAPRRIDEQTRRESRYRFQSFRALLTYSLGTNYPYYVVEGGELQKRVDGNLFGRFLAGPGIVITNPHEAAVISDGMEIKGIGPPGLVFTGVFDRVDQIVDLRTQLRVLDVNALTRDGITVRVPTFVFFRIRTTPQRPGVFWVDGESDKAILQTLHVWPAEEALKRAWDDLPPLRTELILKDIISAYDFDGLCARDEPAWQPDENLPLQRIRTTLETRLREAIDRECKGIEIVGVGIDNPRPVDPSVMQRRIANWHTEWERRMMMQKGEGATAVLRRISEARAQGQAEVIRILTEEAKHLEGTDKDVLADVLTLQLLETLNDIARRPSVQQVLSAETMETMEHLQRAAEESGSATIQGAGR